MNVVSGELFCNGAYIRDVRVGLGLNQAQFGRLINLHPVTISKLENDKVRVDGWQRTIIEAIGQTLRHQAGIRPDLDAILESCGPVYVLWMLLNRAYGVHSGTDPLAPPG